VALADLSRFFEFYLLKEQIGHQLAQPRIFKLKLGNSGLLGLIASA